MADEVLPWLNSLPLAPEYRPTLAEFLDPISYIHKIEAQASKIGICKIIPPIPNSPTKNIIANLNHSLSSINSDSSPTFTTRVQNIGISPRKHLPQVQKSVRESGKTYTVAQFEAKAKKFEKNYLKKEKMGLTELEVETLYWKAQMEKRFKIEYANDMPGSAFDQLFGGAKQGKNEIGDVTTVGESLWNTQRVSRAKGSLLRFIKEEIPGVTSPMVYLAMLFSWFAWHVEDHDFHSLNYMHMGAAKTWYGVPKDAAVAFEEVVRTHGYGGEINPIVTYATLAQKNTVMSPEVLVKAGVHCYRLVQNAGEFVVTFPTAYHSGFSHGFNCAEAVNIATPAWLNVARDATIRRASTNYAPMVSHTQLLYDLALSLSSNEQPRSSRLKDKLEAEEEASVKRLFVEDMMQNNKLLHELGNGFPIVVLSEKALQSWIPSDSRYRTRSKSKTKKDESSSSKRKRYSSFGSFASPKQHTGIEKKEIRKPDPASVFSCVACGNLCHSCIAIVQPSMEAARYLMSGSYKGGRDLIPVAECTSVVILESSLGGDGLIDVPIRFKDDGSGTTVVAGPEEVDSALKLLALAYGDSSDSEEVEDSVNNLMEMNHGKKKTSSLINPDSSRMHVLCREHAREVQERLRPVGGVHMLLLCHPDYPEIDAEARLMAEELGTDGLWTDLGYRHFHEYDKEKIRLALDNDQTAHGSQDWIVRLGLDIYYSARLSRSPVYAKKMPPNPVIYNAFGHISPSDESTKSKSSGNKKKAGKWCRKVRMPNLEEDDETSGSNLSLVDVKIETQTENSKKRKLNDKAESSQSPPPAPPSPPPVANDPPQNGGSKRPRRTNLKNNQTRKRKLPNLNKKSRKTDSDSDDEYLPPNTKVEKTTKTKKAKKGGDVDEESEDERKYECDIEGCGMRFNSKRDLKDHRRRNVCPLCGKEFFSHKYLLRKHKRVHIDSRPLKCPWAGCSETFNWAWARTEHYRVHTGARPYECKEKGCGQTFRFVSDFSRHKRMTGHSVKK